MSFFRNRGLKCIWVWCFEFTLLPCPIENKIYRYKTRLLSPVRKNGQINSFFSCISCLSLQAKILLVFRTFFLDAFASGGLAFASLGKRAWCTHLFFLLPRDANDKELLNHYSYRKQTKKETAQVTARRAMLRVERNRAGISKRSGQRIHNLSPALKQKE